MKKTVLCTFVLSWASMANSACLTSACESNEKSSFACVHSNNLRKVAVLNNRYAASCCAPVPSRCSCHDIKETTHCHNPRNDIAWANLNNMSGIADPVFEDCACVGSCDTVCSSCDA